MLDTSEALRLILAALGLGVALPVMLQLYLALRDIRQTARTLDSSLQALRELTPQRPAPECNGSQLTALIAAAIPALSAGFRAFRQHQLHSQSEADSQSHGTPKPEESP